MNYDRVCCAVQLDAALAVDALSVVVHALMSLVSRRRDVTQWSRGQRSHDCHVVDRIRPTLLGHVVNDNLQRVSRIKESRTQLELQRGHIYFNGR